MPSKSKLTNFIRIVSSTVALVLGLSACGSSSSSDDAADTTIPQIPAAPSLKVTALDKIDISWPAVDNTTKYKLYRHTSDATSSATLIASPTTLNHSDTGLTTDTSYYYWLKACNINGCSDFSLAASATITTVPPQTPAAPSLTVTALDTIDIAWEKVADTNEYELYRNTNDATGSATLIASPTTINHSDTGLTTNTSYYYWLKACNINGCSDFSLAASATITTVPPQIPAAPSLKVTALDKIDISWPAVDNTTKYKLYRHTSDATSSATLIASPTTLNHSDTGLTTDTSYYYWLKACNINGCSDFSLAASATITTVPPQTPAAPSLTVTALDTIDIAWEKVADTNEYELYRNTNDATGSATLIASPTTINHSDTGLTTNTSYYYWLKACNINGCSDFSLAASATITTVPPQIPTAPSLTVVDFDKIDIAWTEVDNTSNYELYRHTSDATGSATLIDSPTNASYQDTGLTNNTSYYYWLKACNINGCSDFSPVASDTTTHQIPVAPLLTVVDFDKIDITWAEIDNTTNYELYRHTSDAAGSATLIASPTTLNHLDTGLVSNTSYYYWLKACNINGCSDFSPVASDTTTHQIPVAPLLTVVDFDKIDITWAEIDNTSNYELYRHTSDAAGSATLIASPTTLNHLDTGLVSNTSYYYWLKACNINGCSDFSLVASDTTTHQVPAAPLLTVTALDTIDIAWAEIDNTSNYELYRNTSDATGSASLIASPTTNSYQDTGLTNNTSYYYWLKACNINGCSDFSLVASDTTTHQVPAAPLLTVTALDRIDITWTEIDNTTNYEIYRNTDDASNAATLIASPTTNSYQDTGLTSNTSYYYWLKACNANGCSDLSLAASATTLLQSYNVHAEIGASDTIIKYYTTEAIDYYRTTEKDCDLANHSLCANSTLEPFPENATNNPSKILTSFTDDYMTLDNLINNPQPTYVHLATSDQTFTFDIADVPHFSARQDHQLVVLNNEIYVIGGEGDSNKNDVWKSSDGGVSWTLVTASASFSARQEHQSVIFNNEIYVIGGSDGNGNFKHDIWKSSDGATWTEVTVSASFSARDRHQAVVLNNEIYVIGGWWDGALKNDVWKSNDGGANWTLATASASFSARQYYQAVVLNNEIYVIGGHDHDGAGFDENNDVWKSSDGANWTLATASASFSARANHQAVVLNNEIYVIGGNDGTPKNDVWKSSDGGVSWTEITASAGFPAGFGHRAVVFNNEIYVIGGWENGPSNDVWQSSDGANWAEVTAVTASAGFSARAEHQSVVLNNEIYVIGGGEDSNTRKNDVWKSSDGGVNWTEMTASAGFSARYGHQAVVLNNEIYVIGGNDGNNKNDVWKSSDGGVNWTTITASAGFSPRIVHQAVVVNNEIYVIGGNDGNNNKNDVWKSSDGIAWETVTASASFSPRAVHRTVVINNDIYVIGGWSGSGRKNDVWKSSDGGVNWTTVTASADFSPRSGHQAVVVNNDIYVIGGWSGSGRKNDVWKSSDGANWTTVTASAGFSSRSAHQAVVLNNEIYVIGGGEDSNTLKNDVWRSDPSSASSEWRLLRAIHAYQK